MSLTPEGGSHQAVFVSELYFSLEDFMIFSLSLGFWNFIMIQPRIVYFIQRIGYMTFFLILKTQIIQFWKFLLLVLWQFSVSFSLFSLVYVCVSVAICVGQVCVSICLYAFAEIGREPTQEEVTAIIGWGVVIVSYKDRLGTQKIWRKATWEKSHLFWVLKE